MSPDQITAVTAAGDSLRADPRPWSELTAFEAAVLKAGLLPHPSFTAEQSSYLQLWWLACTAGQATAANNLCPPDTIITARADAAGDLFLSADLLSDALDGGRLADLLPLLSSLTLVCRLPDSWPSPPAE